MANSNVTDLRHQSQFKDYISARERLLICGVNCDIKNSLVTKSQSANKNERTFRRFTLCLKTVFS